MPKKRAKAQEAEPPAVPAVVETMPALPGRPTDYRPEYAEEARKLCILGATDIDLADFFAVSDRTIYRWQIAHEEFCQALKAGKAEADERVEQSLYHKAVGYTFDSEKVFQHQGSIVRATTREHVPPSDTAAIFWLKNRRPAEWRDRHQLEHTGENGGPVEVSGAPAALDIARRLLAMGTRVTLERVTERVVVEDGTGRKDG